MTPHNPPGGQGQLPRPARQTHHIDQARADDERARCVIRKLRYRLRDAMHRHGPMLPDLGLTLGIVLIFTAFLAADRVIAGFVQCEAAQTCPRSAQP